MRLTIRRAISGVATAIALVLSIAACDAATGLRSGTVSLYRKDLPGDVEAAVVTIDEIYLTGA